MRAFGLLELLLLGIGCGQEVIWAEMQNWQLFTNYPWLPDLLLAIVQFLISLLLSPIPTIPRIVVIFLDVLCEIVLTTLFIVAIIQENDAGLGVKVGCLVALGVIERVIICLSYSVHKYTEDDEEIQKQAASMYMYSFLVFGASFLFGFMANFCTVESYLIGTVLWSRIISGSIAIILLPVTISLKGKAVTTCFFILFFIGMTVVFALNLTTRRLVPVIPYNYYNKLPAETQTVLSYSGSLSDLESLYLRSPDDYVLEVPEVCQGVTVNSTYYFVCGNTLAISALEAHYCYSHSLLASAFISCPFVLAILAGVLAIVVYCCGCVGGHLSEAIGEIKDAIS